jgi:hypothetical protein
MDKFDMIVFALIWLCFGLMMFILLGNLIEP